jgi:hypothetical protein
MAGAPSVSMIGDQLGQEAMMADQYPLIEILASRSPPLSRQGSTVGTPLAPDLTLAKDARWT